jgi:hypothetical protein
MPYNHAYGCLCSSCAGLGSAIEEMIVSRAAPALGQLGVLGSVSPEVVSALINAGVSLVGNIKLPKKRRNQQQPRRSQGGYRQQQAVAVPVVEQQATTSIPVWAMGVGAVAAVGGVAFILWPKGRKTRKNGYRRRSR